MSLPCLYSTDSKGVKRYWQIEVHDNTIVTSYGQVGGEEIRNEETISKGKNIGKANETTPHQQAVSQAKAKWKKKHDAGYHEEGKERPVLLPMLAHDYHKRGHDIKFPCYVQPKIDGVRGFIYRDESTNEIVILSRTGKPYNHLQHIKEEIKSSGILNDPNIVLDGELFTFDLTFEEITGVCRKNTMTKEYKAKMNKIQFWTFDIVHLNNLNMHFEKRLNVLINTVLSNKSKLSTVVLVDTLIINKKEDMKTCHGNYIEKGFEGIILRNIKGTYKIKNRSKDLQKYKEFQDDEYTIVDFTEGVGLAKGTVIWICEYHNTKNDKMERFNVRPRGSTENRKTYFQNGDDYIGKKLTVRFQELSDVGCPRFPVGITIRDYE